MLKIFRRLTRFEVSHLNDLPEAAGSFSAYLGSLQDGWISTKDFLADPGVNKAPKGQTTLKPLVDAHDMFVDSPGDLVFFEAASTLVNTKGKLVTKWFWMWEIGRVAPARSGSLWLPNLSPNWQTRYRPIHSAVPQLDPGGTRVLLESSR
jgi:hypothetical protein